jgi:diketogulonate reductase-like aldo/keto reductase
MRNVCGMCWDSADCDRPMPIQPEAIVPQVIIRWHLQLDLVVLPKSSKLERAIENLDVWNFELTEEDMSAVAGLDRADGKTLPNPNDLNA